MDLTQVILGEVTTEKAERLKAQRKHMLRINERATKVDVNNALRKYYGVEPESVRIVNVRAKHRLVGRGNAVRKRQPVKRAIVTLSAKSKVLDLANFQV